MPNLPPLTQSLARIQAWVLEHAPEVIFRPPANPAAIANFSDKSGLALPEELREYLLLADGETRKSAGAIGNWRLLPINEIQAVWGLLTTLAAKGAFAGMAPKTSPYIREAWWHAGWIPVAGSDTGNYFCVDTNPPEPKRTGQVLIFLQERPERHLVAGSLPAWFDRIARDLETNVYAYDTINGFDGEAFMWSSLEGKHLFDHKNGKQVARAS